MQSNWDYNPIEPKGIGSIQLTLPSGKSRFESENGGLDSRGNGFAAFGVGTLLTKTFGDIDTFISVEAHKGLSKSVQTALLARTLKPRFGGSFGLGAGLPGRLRFNFSVVGFAKNIR